MGASSSTASSEQSAEASLTQQYNGTCNIQCQDLLSNVSVDIINTQVEGGINLKQTCTSNGNCLFNNVADASADIMFKARNSSNAKNAGSLFSGSVFNFDSATSSSRQNIKESIAQTTSQNCNISSLNQMDNISILAVNSTIGGGINLAQKGSATGKCSLGSTMSAAAYATGMATNTATSGKDKKGEKFGDKGQKLIGLTYLAIGIAIIILATVFGKYITGKQKAKKLTASEKMVAIARARAGCPGGVDPVRVNGKIVINQQTLRPVCPASSELAVLKAATPQVQLKVAE